MGGRDVAQFGSALDWGSRGRRFKSGRPDQKVQVRRGSGFSLGPLFDLREPIGEPPQSHKATYSWRAYSLGAPPGPRLAGVVLRLAAVPEGLRGGQPGCCGLA